MKIKVYFVLFLGFSAFLLSMSESPYFPWPNIGAVFALIAIVIFAMQDMDMLSFFREDE